MSELGGERGGGGGRGGERLTLADQEAVERVDHSGDTLDPLKKSAGKCKFISTNHASTTLTGLKKQTNKQKGLQVVVRLTNIHTC